MNQSNKNGVEEIEQLLRTYEKELNASNTSAIIPLYTKDGVFMPQNSPSQIGTEALRAAYDQVFANITLAVTFDIAEIVVASPDWAFARTNSVGNVTIMATGDRAPEANQELFVLNRDDSGSWKIARYAFSTINPPKQ